MVDIEALKEHIYENNYIEDILADLGCHHIKFHSTYYSAANPDGDNTQAIRVKNNEWLSCDNYTRQMIKGNRQTDLIDLVCYIKDCSFPEALNYLCGFVGIDYYHDFDEDIPDSLLITDMILGMSSENIEEKSVPLKPINKKILSYYKAYVNDLFYDDGISYETQQIFGIGYDEFSNRITIPIYSEVGDLVGVKGRLLKKELEKNDLKYLYLEPCSRARILYGLNLTIEHIKKLGRVYVLEAEKSVMQLYSAGIYNAVATGGKEFSKQQIDMLVRLGVDIVLALDKDVTKEELKDLIERFPEGVPVMYMYDEDNILSEKQSPSDNIDAWEQLVKNNIYHL